MTSGLTGARAATLGLGLAVTACRQGADRPGTPAATHLARMLIVTSTSTSEPSLTWADMTDLRGPALDAVADVAPWEQAIEVLTIDDTNWKTRLIGTEPDFFTMRAWKADRGALFDPQATDAGAAQIVLGATAAHQLFAGADPVGQTVRVGHRPFEVVGVLAAKGTSKLGEDRDDLAFVPARAFERLHPAAPNVLAGTIWVEATGEDTLDRAEHQVETLLRTRHHLAAGAPDDFKIRNLGALIALQPELREDLP